MEYASDSLRAVSRLVQRVCIFRGYVEQSNSTYPGHVNKVQNHIVHITSLPFGERKHHWIMLFFFGNSFTLRLQASGVPTLQKRCKDG